MNIDNFVKIIFYNLFKWQAFVNRKSEPVDETVFAIFMTASSFGSGVALMIFLIFGIKRMSLDIALYLMFLLIFTFGGISIYLMWKNLLKEHKYKDVMTDRSLGVLKYKIMTVSSILICFGFPCIVMLVYWMLESMKQAI